MTLPIGLKYAVNEEQVEWLVKVAPDELAPQLSRIVSELFRRETEHIVKVAKLFVKTTVLTDTFKSILGEVFGALSRNGVFTKWLNLDMGSGKTHLLALITYLLYAYKSFEEELEDYRKLGLSRDIAEKTALLIIDMRTPSEIPTTFFPFFAESLRRVGESDAANYIKSCVERGETPIAVELVRKLKRATRLVVIIDELHHALLTYRGTPSEREWIKKAIDFVAQLMNYLRHYERGFVILIASARHDYERVLQLEGSDELIIVANNLLAQLGRLEPILESKWLSVEDAKHIVLNKLGAKQDIFHTIFNRFIERVIKAESDIPQAQHLRSLIKSMAVYTKNAIDLGHRVVTPASFSEGVLDALFPEGGGIAERYKSVYSKIMSDIGGLEGVLRETKDVAKWIVNIIFAMSVSGRMDQLLETIRAYKFGRYTLELLPAVSEQDIKKVLEDLRISDDVAISKAFDILSGVSYVHSIKVGNTYMYFVVPVEYVVAIFKRLIEERYKHNLTDREGMVNELIGRLYTISGKVDEYGYIVVVNDYSSLEESTKGVDPNVMYTIIYADPELTKHLEESLRSGAPINVDDLIKEYFKKKGLKDPATWLEEHHKYNVAISMLVPNDDVVKGVAQFKAFIEATNKIVNDYLLEYIRGGNRLSEEIRKLIEIEQAEIHKAIGSSFADYLKRFVDASSLALSHVYIYECNYGAEQGVRCLTSLKEVKATREVGSGIAVNQNVYNELIEKIERIRDREIKDLAKELVKAVRKYANFVDDLQTTRNTLMSYVKETLSKHKEVMIAKDMNTYIYGSQIFYIPPDLVDKAIQSIQKEKDKLKETLKKTLEKDVEIQEKEGVVHIIIPEGPPPPPPPPPLPPPSTDEFSKTIDTIKVADKGLVNLSLEFDKSSKNVIITNLYSLKRYIKRIEVKAS